MLCEVGMASILEFEGQIHPLLHYLFSPPPLFPPVSPSLFSFLLSPTYFHSSLLPFSPFLLTLSFLLLLYFFLFHLHFSFSFIPSPSFLCPFSLSHSPPSFISSFSFLSLSSFPLLILLPFKTI